MAQRKPSHQRQVVIAEDGKPKVAKEIDPAALRDKSEMFVAKNLAKYLKKLHELAMGVTVVKSTKSGPKIYSQEPDRQALEYLINRGLGKIPERHEVTGADGESLQTVIPWMPAQLMEGEPAETVDSPDITVLNETPEIADASPEQS